MSDGSLPRFQRYDGIVEFCTQTVCQDVEWEYDDGLLSAITVPPEASSALDAKMRKAMAEHTQKHTGKGDVKTVALRLR